MSRTRRGTTKKQPSSESRRSGAVWLALVGAMTCVGGTLWALQSGPMPRLDGLALPALVSAAGPSSIEAAFSTRTALDTKRWISIVVHHSASLHETPASLGERHRAQGLTGLGHHFVIGNGSGIGDGDLHVGYRWLEQVPGAHVAGPRGDEYNRTSIGICLIGDGRRRPFTDLQVLRLVQLVRELSDRFGIPADHVHLHSDLAEADDPGRFFPAAAFRQQLSDIH